MKPAIYGRYRIGVRTQKLTLNRNLNLTGGHSKDRHRVLTEMARTILKKDESIRLIVLLDNEGLNYALMKGDLSAWENRVTYVKDQATARKLITTKTNSRRIIIAPTVDSWVSHPNHQEPLTDALEHVINDERTYLWCGTVHTDEAAEPVLAITRKINTTLNLGTYYDIALYGRHDFPELTIDGTTHPYSQPQHLFRDIFKEAASAVMEGLIENSDNPENYNADDIFYVREINSSAVHEIPTGVGEGIFFRNVGTETFAQSVGIFARLNALRGVPVYAMMSLNGKRVPPVAAGYNLPPGQAAPRRTILGLRMLRECVQSVPDGGSAVIMLDYSALHLQDSVDELPPRVTEGVDGFDIIPPNKPEGAGIGEHAEAVGEFALLVAAILIARRERGCTITVYANGRDSADVLPSKFRDFFSMEVQGSLSIHGQAQVLALVDKKSGSGRLVDVYWDPLRVMR